MITIGLLHATIRGDEKLILDAAKKRDVKINLIDIRTEIFNPETYKADFDVALQRSVSTVKGTYATNFLEMTGIKIINSSAVTALCEDKFYTSLTLQQAKVPTCKFALVFTPDQAVVAIEQMGGFPVVIKPPLGSWGRLDPEVRKRFDIKSKIYKETRTGHKSVCRGE
ncbi:MAG: Lysine biosynthesis enzyme LysX [Candidatus Gottesmanbacteria bacterium GW2011_GWC2_39_8]|uniref:Lysine biosynthesis enzyme LysX n=1 Tax=Candidatus Gottesmanbacteria bacterium GW2011_GWC2_39_8 TaxID=1618450 RepID=A0A0G0Q2P9_9BACT|nr:MAG: Lysine biosynthesis enzyme LysX [Candidatus Gottesmanbacteria bacterium GW2011_GWC2_39_8]